MIKRSVRRRRLGRSDGRLMVLNRTNPLGSFGNPVDFFRRAFRSDTSSTTRYLYGFVSEFYDGDRERSGYSYVTSPFKDLGLKLRAGTSTVVEEEEKILINHTRHTCHVWYKTLCMRLIAEVQRVVTRPTNVTAISLRRTKSDNNEQLIVKS